MQTFNLYDGDDWDSENDRDGYRHRVTAFGKRLGATLLGGSLYELPPGEKTWPYHYEQGSEEWLLVVAGNPTLRSPDSEQLLEPGDVAVFPEGPAGAHQVLNKTTEPIRVVLFSKSPLAVVHYPDSGKVGVWSQDEGYQAMLRTEPKLDYWEGE
ncbi:MAG: cupin domain-containing protein [Actinobacteria bacterium]|nr:cupin domain-containing protein [Actinomycetota bacterium]